MFQRRKCHVDSHNSVLHIIPNSRFFLWTGHVTAIPNQKHLRVCVCAHAVPASCKGELTVCFLSWFLGGPAASIPT